MAPKLPLSRLHPKMQTPRPQEIFQLDNFTWLFTLANRAPELRCDTCNELAPSGTNCEACPLATADILYGEAGRRGWTLPVSIELDAFARHLATEGECNRDDFDLSPTREKSEYGLALGRFEFQDVELEEAFIQDAKGVPFALDAYAKANRTRNALRERQAELRSHGRMADAAQLYKASAKTVAKVGAEFYDFDAKKLADALPNGFIEAVTRKAQAQAEAKGWTFGANQRRKAVLAAAAWLLEVLEERSHERNGKAVDAWGFEVPEPGSEYDIPDQLPAHERAGNLDWECRQAVKARAKREAAARAMAEARAIAARA